MPLVENGEVGADGASLLAFIDVCEERELRWSARQMSDGSYKIDVLAHAETGTVISGTGGTLSLAVKDVGRRLMAEGIRGLPTA